MQSNWRTIYWIFLTIPLNDDDDDDNGDDDDHDDVDDNNILYTLFVCLYILAWMYVIARVAS